MNTLRLTQEQRKKLLEMCQTLFPEWIQIEIGGNIGMITGFKSHPPTRNYDEIHWFEFCLTSLVDKINYPPNMVNNSSLITSNDIMNANHPVDYLYSQFKLIKP